MLNEVSDNAKARPSHNDIPLRDSIFLSPIEKYKIYGRFPWKMVIHIFIVIATTAQVMITVVDTTQYTRAQERLLYNQFISESDKTETDYSRKTYLFSVSQLRDHLKKSINNFYNFQSESLEQVEYLDDPENLYVNMKFSYYDKHLLMKSAIPHEYDYKVNQTNLGPFDYSDPEVKNFLNSVTEFELNYTLRTYIPFYFGDNFQCYHWEILQEYNFFHRAHFVVNLRINRNTCTDRTNLTLFEYFINRLIWIHLLVIILSVLSLILTWKYVYKMAKLYWKIKRRSKEKRSQVGNTEDHENNQPNQNSADADDVIIPKDKNMDINFDLNSTGNNYAETTKKNKSNPTPQIFNMWSLICLVGNLAQIFGSLLRIFDHNNIMTSTEVIVGFSCMFAYINVGRYLEYNRDYSTIFATIKRAMPNVLRYLFGVMPIFFGFIFFGLCLFWRSERFVSTSSTMMTLFAMLNGDSVFDIFHDLSGVSFFIGQFYCYIFCIIFIVVVMNVFISIIEEAYVSTKMQNQNHWIYSYLKIDPNYIHIKDIEDSKRDESMVKPSQERETFIVKEKSRLLQSINSKNIFREAISSSFNKFEKKETTDEMNKQNIEKTLENHFMNIEKSLNEVESISDYVTRTNDTLMKDEMRLVVFDHISNLESKVSHLRDMWSQHI